MDKVAKSLASISLITTLAASGLPVFAQSNPVDPVSNPQLLEYADVAVLPKEMDPPFVRQGQILDPSALHVIDVGTTQDVVRSVLGCARSMGIQPSVRDAEVGKLSDMPIQGGVRH